MSLYMNSTSIAGYLVADPDGSPTKEGLPRTRFTVALNHPKKSSPDYIRCVAWGERAVTIAKYARKGQGILVSGELETSTWSDRNQMRHTTTEIVVEKFSLITRPRPHPNEATIRRPTPKLSE
jgi:single-strand DNA-binding protein